MISPTFPGNFSMLSTSFDIFCNHAVLSFGTASRNPVPPKKEKKYTQIYLTSKQLSLAWINFINNVNELADVGVKPYQLKIDAEFEAFGQYLNQVIAKTKKTQFLPYALINTINSLGKSAQKAHQTIDELFVELVESMENAEYSAEMCLAELHQVFQQTIDLFEKDLPKDIFKPRESCRLRTAMKNSIASVLEIIKSMKDYQATVSAIKSDIFSFNAELTHINTVLKLPFEVTLSVENE